MLLAICFSMTACKKSSFVATNINPNTLYTVDPADQFLAAAAGSQDDFEYFYDVYRAINFWLQYTTAGSGNSPGFTHPTANFDYRYGKIFYGRVGAYLSDIPALVSKMNADDQSKRVYQLNIATIFKAYYAFYVSDINGSIPYTQAFQSRYGGTYTPKYDPQQDLFDTLDVQIKKAVANLEAPQTATQTSFGAKDPFFSSTITGSASAEAMAWVKIGNAVRLKMAMRLMKRDATKMQTIVSDVLADANQMSSIDDSWFLPAGPTYAKSVQQSNYNPLGFNAAKPVVDFMLTKSDPRLRIFYRPRLKDNTYVGAPTSPDDAALPANQDAFLHSDSAFSQLQHRLFTPDYDEGDGNGNGTGSSFFPFLTFAEYCFIRAELGARGVTSDPAATWYANGVTASIQFYDQRAVDAGISNYNTVAQSEIDAYLLQPGVAFDVNKAVEQIACQAYLDFFRQPSEGWAWWKRTGFPNTTSVLAWSPLTASGTALDLPRRASLQILPTTDANYANQKAAYDAMAADPNFGSGPDDGFGRVWWDTK